LRAGCGPPRAAAVTAVVRGRYTERMPRWLLALGALLTLTACDSAPRYVGVGDVISVDAAAQQVVLRHEQIAGLAEAGVSRFGVPSDQVRAALTPGARVRFELQRNGGVLVITRASPLAEGNPGIHDHTPHHGGIVAMAGMLHLEAKASADGRVLLYLTDIWRRPVPLDGVSGTATFDLPGGRQKQTVPLASVGDALEARGPALAPPAVNVAFDLRRGGEPVELSFLLPLGSGDSGAAGIPAAGCLSPADTAASVRQPRCTLSFAKPIVALAVAPDAATLLVAQLDLGISAWRLPAAVFALGFAPPPAVIIPVAEPPHPEAPNAVVVRPDGREAVVAMENRLIVYAMDTGQVVRAFDGPGGVVRAVAWSPDGSALLAATFYSPAAFVLDAADGRVQLRLPVTRETAALAFAPDGETMAVASEAGPIVLYDRSGAVVRTLRDTRAAARALAFAGDRLVAAGQDGVLYVWDRRTGASQFQRAVARTLRQLAVNAERGIVATAGTNNLIQVTALADDAGVETLSGHAAQVLNLAWAGSTLISGDAAGRVALWEIAP